MTFLLTLLLAGCSTQTSALPGDTGVDGGFDATPIDSAMLDSAMRDSAIDSIAPMDSSVMDAADTAPPPSDASVDTGPPPRPTAPFGTPRLITELSDPDWFDDDPTLSADRLVIVFNSTRDTGIDDLFMSERASVGDSWPAPRRLTEINSPSMDTTPGLSGDGLTLHFASSRAGGLGGLDIYRTSRAARGGAWSSPTHVDVLSSAIHESAVSPILDETLTAIVLEDTGNPHIFESRRASSSEPWSTPVELNLTTSSTERSSRLEASGLGVWFESNRPGGSGNYDLYFAVRPAIGSPFEAPINVSELNTAFSEGDPWISPDLRHIVFVSNRTGSYELYEASR